MTKPITLITGATSGIGLATARKLASRYKLILCGRRHERLVELEEELSSATDIKILTFDIRDKSSIEKSLQSLPEDWKKVEVLINNAGNAHGLDPIHEGDVEDWEMMIDINVKGLLYISRQLTPGMVERKSGHIINIGSTAGKQVYPGGNVYCASKFAVDALSQAMRIDLNPYGIKVSQISPGMVNTEFSSVRFKGDSKKADNVYKGLTPMVADDIADIIEFTLSRPKHVNIADLVVMPTDQASSYVVRRDN